MKIKIAYQDEERTEMEAALNALQDALPRLRAKESDVHAPYRHIYLTTPKKELH